MYISYISDLEIELRDCKKLKNALKLISLFNLNFYFLRGLNLNYYNIPGGLSILQYFLRIRDEK